MNHIFYTVAVAIAFAMGLTACGHSVSKTSGCADITPREILIGRLARVSADGKYAFGHHDDTAYGYTWRGESDRSDVNDVVGDYPAVMNWDLGLVEWGCDKELDSVPFDLIRTQAVKQHDRGGINTFSWHPRNPATGGDSWDLTGGEVVKACVTPGNALNDTMKVWIGRAADFIASIKDSVGDAVPVVFRPWHEHTGSWFWWGSDFASADDYKALWRMTYDIFRNKGLDNVVWAYSPDVVADSVQYLERYPGDSIVDIMGADVYHFGGEDGIDEYYSRAKRTLSAAARYAKSHGKLVALTETGSEALPIADWYTRVLAPLCEQYPIAYVTVWRNAPPHEKAGHFYVPYPGHPAEDSFKAFYADEHTIFARDMKKY